MLIMLNLSNKFIFAPIKLGYANGDGIVTQKHFNFYKARSKNIGAVTYEPLYMDAGLRELPTQLGIDADDKIAGLSELNKIVKADGAKTIAHLNHPGRMANPKIPGNYFLSSVDVACENGGAIPKQMTRDDMNRVVELFKSSAVRAEKAGFDFIELQFGYGYLFAQFISQAVNTRNDEYGGSFEKRIKFPLEVLEAVKSATKLPIIARMSADEMMPNGFGIMEMRALAKILESNGVVALHVTAGSACSTPPWFFQHMFVPKGKTWSLADTINRSVKIPVIFVGRINSVSDINKIKNDYNADYFALGRALVADPEFTTKYLNKKIIKPCLACSEGCLGGVKSGKGLGCILNPSVGREEIVLEKTNNPKNIAIVGAGIAGMQSAIYLKEKGHNVFLYEKDRVGGQFNLAWLPPKKESLKEILTYFDSRLKEQKIEVVRKEVNAENILEGNFDEVVVASGAVPAILPIKGLNKYMWADFMEKDNLPTKERILIIGGGLIGIEIASKLVDLKNKVIIVEMLGEVARGMEMLEKKLSMQKLGKAEVEILLNTKVTEINNSTVYLESEGERSIIEDIDGIFVASGMRSVNSLISQLEGRIPVSVVGDAKQPSNVQNAISTAFETAMRL